jgi:hypothetical protein
MVVALILAGVVFAIFSGTERFNDGPSWMGIDDSVCSGCPVQVFRAASIDLDPDPLGCFVGVMLPERGQYGLCIGMLEI